MATQTFYASKRWNITGNKSTFTYQSGYPPANMTDGDLSTRAGLKVPVKSGSAASSLEFYIYGFDFSSIPEGAKINSVTYHYKVSCRNNNNIRCFYVGTANMVNGALSSYKTNPNEKIAEYSGVVEGTSSCGTWTADELKATNAGTIGDGTYNGLAIRVKWTSNDPIDDNYPYNYEHYVTVDYVLRPPQFDNISITYSGEKVSSNNKVPANGYYFIRADVS